MNYMVEYDKWINDNNIGLRLKEELLTIYCNKEIEDRFYKKLEFGTAGIRGVLGAGTNRMNVHTVAEVAKGLAKKILADKEADRGVVIAYDVRHQSREFAELSSAILSSHGIRVYLFQDVTPTPVLSYAIRELKAIAGIMITASHNPKEYNGYKVYWEDGTQISGEIAEDVIKYISLVQNPYSIKEFNFEDGVESGIISYVDEDITENYTNGVLGFTINDENINKDISIVYSPLNGVGMQLVKDVLKLRGFSKLSLVSEQEYPDPDFVTVGYPNPEDVGVFEYSVRLGNEVDADVLIATDPDADRVGAMIRHQGCYRLLTGNDLGTLMTHYMLSQLSSQSKLKEDSRIVKTIVTDNIVDSIAKDYGVEVFDVHVGFKNIYSLVNDWEESGVGTYVLGYEESLGFGIGSNLARDKDAISASMIIVEMVAYYNLEGKTLIDILKEIQNEYGYHSEHLESVTMPGINGQKQMEEVVARFRINPMEELNRSKLTSALDYLADDTGLDKMNVLKYKYEDGTWFAIRPSGTEPKLKLYIYAAAATKELSERNLIKAVKVIKESLSQ